MPADLEPILIELWAVKAAAFRWFTEWTVAWG